MATVRSRNLFHMTKKFEDLTGILRCGGFYPYYKQEDIHWLGIGDRFIAFPRVCFCDIPLGRIAEHVGFYGRYGVGMGEDWARSNHLNPVTYLADHSSFAENYRAVLGTASVISNGPKRGLGFESYLYMIAHTRPIEEMVIDEDGKKIPKKLYHESEWRYVPNTDRMLSMMDEHTYKAAKRDLDEDAEANPLRFSPNDVRYIFLPTEAQIPKLVDFIHDTLGGRHPDLELKIMMTRIISLEKLENDL